MEAAVVVRGDEIVGAAMEYMATDARVPLRALHGSDVAGPSLGAEESVLAAIEAEGATVTRVHGSYDEAVARGAVGGRADRVGHRPRHRLGLFLPVGAAPVQPERFEGIVTFFLDRSDAVPQPEDESN